MQNRGILIALRAAAVVIIATGLNDVLAGAIPRYEPLWLYLAAVAVVSLLDGAIVGIVTALLSIAFYALLFMTRSDALSARIAIPLGAALGVAIAASIVRGFARSRRRQPETLFPPMPPLLESSEVAKAAFDNTEVLAAIDELRNELRSSGDASRQLERERDWALKFAEESRLRADRETTLRAQAEQLLAEAREEASNMAGRVAELEVSLHEAERMRSELALERSRAAAEKALRERLEKESATLREQVGWIPGLESERTQLTARLAEVERALSESRAAVTARIAGIERTARQLLESETAARDEARAEAERLTIARDQARAEIEALTARVAEVEAAAAQAAAEREAARAEAQRLITSRDEARAEVGRLTARVAEAEAAIAQASTEREAARAEAQRLITSRDEARAEVGRLTARVAEAEAAIAAASTEQEAAHSRIAELKKSAAEVTTARDEARVEVRRLSARIAELEHSAAEVTTARDEARAEVEALTARIADLEHTREGLESDAAEFDKRLQTIVTHLASDHETDLGQALSDKEEARAEARSLSMKLAALQRKLDEEREAREALEALLTETRTAAQAEINRLRAVPAPPPAHRPRVLIVHPDAELRGSAGATLERAGYEVVGAGDGLEALRVAIARQPDVVIAEGSMPKMDGRELCQLLKSQEKTAHIRVILLMRANAEAPRGELLPDEVLRKPVPVETLKSTLAGLLASNEQRATSNE